MYVRLDSNGTASRRINNYFCVFLYWSSKTIKETQKRAKKQYEFQFFAEYTKRYQDIILHMPDDVNDPHWLRYVQLYFDLCSEEFYLHEEGLISNRVWQLWVKGMQDILKRESFKNAWKGNFGQYYTDRNFISFMHHNVIKV